MGVTLGAVSGRTGIAPQLDAWRREVEGFRWELPDRWSFGRDVVERWAADPQRPALDWRDARGARQTLGFGDVRDGARRLAGLLEDLGVAAGEPVIVMLPRIPSWHRVMVGVLQAGALAIPCSTLLRPRDLAYRIRHSGAVALVVAGEQIPTCEAISEELPSLRHRLAHCEPGASLPGGWLDLDAALAGQSTERSGRETRASEPALVFYTSGTTGPPKAVLHSHAYTAAQRFTSRYWHGLREGERIWTTSDTGWAKAAYGVLFGPWGLGAEVALYDGRFEAARELELLAEIDPHVFCAPPTEYRMLVKQPLTGLRVPRLRECVSAGEPLNPEVIRSWQQATGIAIRDGYGQTESILLVGNLPGMPLRPGSMGLPLPGQPVEVIDEDGRPAEAGQVGDIAVRGRPPGLFEAYWKDPEATERSRRGDWYLTGDRALRDEDGYFWFVGRNDDVIISAGYRIGPFEVESALVEHPDVVEAAAVAAPDPERGQVVKAYVVLRPGLSGDAELARRLQEHVKQVTAPYKYPRSIVFSESLPKTVSGKIRRVELRQRS